MGNVSNPRLASAVAGAGGLATIAVWGCHLKRLPIFSKTCRMMFRRIRRQLYSEIQ